MMCEVLNSMFNLSMSSDWPHQHDTRRNRGREWHPVTTDSERLWQPTWMGVMEIGIIARVRERERVGVTLSNNHQTINTPFMRPTHAIIHSREHFSHYHHSLTQHSHSLSTHSHLISRVEGVFTFTIPRSSDNEVCDTQRLMCVCERWEGKRVCVKDGLTQPLQWWC